MLLLAASLLKFGTLREGRKGMNVHTLRKARLIRVS